MPEYVYPSNAELREIEQSKLPLLAAEDPIFEIMPIEEVDAAVLMWEQSDNYQGLQQVRGYNGKPPRVKKVGAKRYIMEPGVYGEHDVIDELELTQRRNLGSFNQPINIADLVMKKQDYLLGRRYDRIRWIGWTLVTTGTFAVAGPNGSIIHTDQYSIQSYTALVAWSTVATATPLQNFRDVKLLARGKSVNFGAQSSCFMNQTTFNRMIANTNAADLYGKRTDGLSNVLSLAQVNAVLAGEDLPTIRIYDEGYEDESGNFQLFIPDGKAVVVGRRKSGARIAEYQMTRNAQNPNLEPGAYMDVVDDPRVKPRAIEIHDGHNGGPALFHPSAIVVMNV